MLKRKRDDPAFEGPVRAVAYIRCSSDRQARQESSLPAQRAEINARAAADGASVLKWFEDDGISGKNVEDRPGMEELLAYVAAHRADIDRMYVYDSKRMARNKADAFAIRLQLRKAGVKLVALAQPSVEDEAANALLESVWDGVAEMERIDLARVVRRGQRQSLIDGWWPYPRPPYGFRIVGAETTRGARRFRLEPDPDTSDVVRKVFALYLAGNGSKNIASILDREGLSPPSRADTPKQRVQGWRAKHVKLIVENPACWGAGCWDGEVVNERHHAAIVPRETWEEAQKLATARARTPSELSSLNTAKSEHGVFRPWLRCGECGGTMLLNRGGTPQRRIWYYTCSTRAQNNASCRGLTAKADELDAALVDTIESDVLDLGNIRRLIESSIAQMSEGANRELAERRATLEKRIEEVSAEMARLTIAISRGVLDVEDARPLTEPLRRRRDELRAELGALPSPQRIPTVDEVNPDRFRQRVAERWRSKDVTVQRKALDRLLVEVVLKPGTALIRYAWKAVPPGYTYQDPDGPPNAPMSLGLPSASLYPDSGFPASIHGENPGSRV